MTATSTAATSRKSLLTATGQAWSLWLGTGLLLVSVVLYALGLILMREADADTFVFVILVAFGASLVGFWFQLGHPRCPACRLRWVYHIVSTVDAGSWLPQVLAADRCPRCGFPDPALKP